MISCRPVSSVIYDINDLCYHMLLISATYVAYISKGQIFQVWDHSWLQRVESHSWRQAEVFDCMLPTSSLLVKRQRALSATQHVSRQGDQAFPVVWHNCHLQMCLCHGCSPCAQCALTCSARGAALAPPCAGSGDSTRSTSLGLAGQVSLEHSTYRKNLLINLSVVRQSGEEWLGACPVALSPGLML